MRRVGRCEVTLSLPRFARIPAAPPTEEPSTGRHDHKTHRRHTSTARLLTAMSLLAFLELRYPVRTLPSLLFDIASKMLWIAVIAIPAWSPTT